MSVELRVKELTPEELQHLIEAAVSRAMERVKPVKEDEGLWDANQVAAYLGISRSTINRISADPDFPRYRLLGTGNKKPRKRWTPEEIKAYAAKRKRS